MNGPRCHRQARPQMRTLAGSSAVSASCRRDIQDFWAGCRNAGFERMRNQWRFPSQAGPVGFMRPFLKDPCWRHFWIGGGTKIGGALGRHFWQLSADGHHKRNLQRARKRTSLLGLTGVFQHVRNIELLSNSSSNLAWAGCLWGRPFQHLFLDARNS